MARKWNSEWRKSLPFVISCWISGFLLTMFPLVGWARFAKSGHFCSLDFGYHHIKTYTFLGYILISFYIFPVVVLITIRILIKKWYLNRVGWWTVNFQRRYMRMEAAMLISFIVCWTPYACVAFLSMLSIGTPPYAEPICKVLAKLSSLSNSLIYCIAYNAWPSYNFRKCEPVFRKCSEKKESCVADDAKTVKKTDIKVSKP